MNFFSALACAALGAISGCVGDEQTAIIHKAHRTYVSDSSEALDLVKESNAMCSDWMREAKLDRHVKRWDEHRLIPVYAPDDDRAKQALAIFEKAFERQIFQPLPDRAALESGGKGIIFSIGTAMPPGEPADKRCRGNVSVGPNRADMPQTLANPDTGEFTGIAWVNLDCYDQVNGGKADVAVAVHELGHAMGMGKEITQSGEPPVTERFWHLMWKLYELPIGTRLEGNGFCLRPNQTSTQVK